MDSDMLVPLSREPGTRATRDVLFVCDHNAGRSQIAESLFERYAPDDLRAESAGSEPAAEIWAPVVDVMGEIGIDLTPRKPKKLTIEMQLGADWAVTMGCGDACPYVPTMVEAWDIPDPAGRSIEEVRAIRDGIEAQVRELLDNRVEAIRSDPTAHQMRLARLLAMLADEFADTKAHEEIRACAEAVLRGFDHARVRSHIMILAHRQARECLRRDTCDVLLTSGAP